MDFIHGWFGTIFYTDKESNLHVSGAVDKDYSTESSTTPTLLTCGSELTETFARFSRDGYCIASSAVDAKCIHEARIYINDHYKRWVKQSKRQDDWRCHLMVDLTTRVGPVEHPAILNLLLRSPLIIQCIEGLTESTISGIFYSQVAFRTPLPPKLRCSDADAPPVPDYATGAEYHLDGQANSSGTRFPDPFSILVGIALVDIVTEDKGNFTVFTGWHSRRNWSNYADEKRTKTLPNLGTPTHVCLRAGDAVLAHVLLPHRGGKNTISPTAAAPDSDNSDLPLPTPWNIPANTREMVFIRVRVAAVQYESPERCPALLKEPMVEFPGATAAAAAVLAQQLGQATSVSTTDSESTETD